VTKITLGIVIGNRGFFPSHLCATGRQSILKALEREGISAVLPGVKDTKFAGSVETLGDARACARIFRERRDDIDGILVTLPNFGDEKAVANTIRWAGLDVPVLVHAFPDDSARMSIKDRRDSFCGKMSVCNNLRQYGIPHSLTALHTVDPDSESFRKDLRDFAAVCRVVKSLRHLRLGAIGARPTAFNTVRYSEKLLERNGISVETLDLSEVLGWANRMLDTNDDVREKMDAIKAYTGTKGVPKESLFRIAKLGVAIDRWMKDNEVAATAIQCWTALEEFYGVVPCTLMSMMSNTLRSSACETDVAGVLGMHVLAAAAGTPAALLDWNNNYGRAPDKGVVFHCSNLPKDWFQKHRMDYQAIIAGSVGKENTFGTIVGRIRPGPFTYCRVSTDDLTGSIRGYVGQGRVTADRLRTFGGFGVIQIPAFQSLLRFICENGFEHHVCGSLSSVAAPVFEALEKYKGWDLYHHTG
jgi:L-fucose isomerase-like protein